jgi:hypothetical protein
VLISAHAASKCLGTETKANNFLLPKHFFSKWEPPPSFAIEKIRKVLAHCEERPAPYVTTDEKCAIFSNSVQWAAKVLRAAKVLHATLLQQI